MVDDSGIFSFFSALSINDNGTVAYRAGLDAGGLGIYTDAGSLVVDDSGQIAFVAELDDGTRGIYLASPVPIPASAWLFGSGLFGLFGIARRKKA